MRKVLSILLLCTWGCAPVASSDQRAVRDAVAAHLAEQGFDQRISPKSLKVTEELVDYSSSLASCYPSEVDLGQLIDGLIEENSTQRFWATSEAFRALRRIGSGDYHDDLPTDHLELSLASFNEVNDTALVYIERHCPLCGFGMFQLVERRGRRWNVEGECHIWVS